MLLFKEWHSVCLFLVAKYYMIHCIVRVVAVLGSAYYGIVKALHDKLEEYIQAKVEELKAEQ